MSWTTISAAVTVHYPQFEMTGPLEYDTDSGLLVHLDEVTGDEEVLSTDLGAYGLVCAPGEAYIKDWSEHSGFTRALAAAGVIEVLDEIAVGPFASRANRVRVLGLPDSPEAACGEAPTSCLGLFQFH